MSPSADLPHRRSSLTGAPRVLLCSPTFPPSTGGIERTAGALAAHLSAVELKVVAGSPRSFAQLDTSVTVPVHWVANDPSGGRRATLLLNLEAMREGLRWRPDVVLALHIRAMPAARALRHRFGTRALLVVHAKELREQPRLARAALAWADRVVAVSHYSRDLALEAGADQRLIRIINPGVRLPQTPPPAISDRADPPTVLTVSRMDDRHKGHLEALRVLALLRQRNPDIRWIMVGEGRLRKQLTADAASLGLSNSVTFTGALDDRAVDQLLCSAHVFCMLSRNRGSGAAGEGFGIVFIEAGAHGVPVVAGRVPGVVDAVDDGQTGLLVDPDDHAAAARAIETLLGDRALADAMGQAGRAKAQELEWALVAQRYGTVIGELLDSPLRKSGRPQLGWMLDLIRGPGEP
jgi:phosphatidyl-myo-inositol dimannoside synthase